MFGTFKFLSFRAGLFREKNIIIIAQGKMSEEKPFVSMRFIVTSQIRTFYIFPPKINET